MRLAILSVSTAAENGSMVKCGTRKKTRARFFAGPLLVISMLLFPFIVPVRLERRILQKRHWHGKSWRKRAFDDRHITILRHEQVAACLSGVALARGGAKRQC